MSGSTEVKELSTAYICAVVAFFFPLPLGGLHHFYLGRSQAGLLYSCTMGLCYWGIIYDLVRMQALVDEANGGATASPAAARIRTQSSTASPRHASPPMNEPTPEPAWESHEE